MKSEFMIAITQLAAEKNLPQGGRAPGDGGGPRLRIQERRRHPGQRRRPHRPRDRRTPRLHRAHGRPGSRRPARPRSPCQDARKLQARRPARRRHPRTKCTPAHAGRIAAQTAKQVVLQRLREAEREMVFEEFSNREGDIVSGVIQRIEPKHIVVDLGKTEAIFPTTGAGAQRALPRPASGMKFYLLEVHRSIQGPAAHPLAHAQEPAEAPVRAGSAGDLPRRRRDQVDRPRGRLPQQGGRRRAAGRRRPGGLVRRPARHPHPEHRQRAERRAHRRHPVGRRRRRSSSPTR